jgi:predicted nucleic acid-binding protein
VDVNIFFSALISRGKTFRIFAINSITRAFELLAPEFLMEELEEHKEEVLSKSKLSALEVEKLLNFCKEK